MPEVSGVLETALYVDDLPRAVRFYEELFGFERMAGDERFCAFNVAGRGVLLLFKRGASRTQVPQPGGLIPPHDGNGPLHFAFAVPARDFESWEKRLREKGIAVESKVRWPQGGQSVYFRDPDGNLAELATPGIWPIY